MAFPGKREMKDKPEKKKLEANHVFGQVYINGKYK